MRVLCIAAHPDDEVLGVAGTLLRHKAAGDVVRVVLVNRCRPAGVLESQDAERVLGIPYTRLWDSVTSIEDVVNDWQPSIVYTHSLSDLHHHHRDVHERVLVACRPQSGVKCIYAFETPSATDWGMRPFEPTLYVDIGQTLEDKLDAMECYHSELRELPHPRNIDALCTRAEYWGQRAGVGWAEAFEVARITW